MPPCIAFVCATTRASIRCHWQFLKTIICYTIEVVGTIASILHMCVVSVFGFVVFAFNGNWVVKMFSLVSFLCFASLRWVDSCSRTLSPRFFIDVRQSLATTANDEFSVDCRVQFTIQCRRAMLCPAELPHQYPPSSVYIKSFINGILCVNG